MLLLFLILFILPIICSLPTTSYSFKYYRLLSIFRKFGKFRILEIEGVLPRFHFLTLCFYMPESKKIAVIEDERPMARALELKLSHVGFDVVTAGNGEEGLAIIEREHPDMVLLDLVMPKRDGFWVLESLKKRGIETPVIILSNLSQGEDEHRAADLGAKGFFVKSDTPIADIVNRVTSFFAVDASSSHSEGSENVSR